jgi:NADPH-dependent 2,4-dienoyl-CoA reductase/sulfur reductase-like enzyme
MVFCEMANDSKRYVIVGNGFAGTTAAEHLRKLDPTSSIVMFADEPYPLYNRISLPPFLRGQLPEAKVFMRDIAAHEKHAIDLHLGTRVEAIDEVGKTVTAGGREWPYDALLVATGGRPNPADVPGAEGAQNVYNFQYMDDLAATHAVEECGLDRRIVHRVRTRGSLRRSQSGDALARARAALPAPYAR